MNRIAVDVVLLPDERITEHAIEINSRLVKDYGPRIVLNKTNCLPHVSLAMGCIEPGQIESGRQQLEAAANAHSPGELIITGIVTTLSGKGLQVSSFVLARTTELQSLHEDVTGRMQPYFSYDVTPEMICSDEPVAESTFAWIRTFREKSSFGAYFPHITLGYGMVDQPMTFPMHMTASRLALCHLGNHCTCRKVLTHIDY